MDADVRPSDERRRELGTFLRARREQLIRADHGLGPVARGRSTGLRREEIAYHSGVSVTWYTWLEQGRDINPSRQVLDAVAHTMRLTADEHHYVLRLAGFAPAPGDDLAVVAAPAHLQHLLDAQGHAPAFAIAPDWTIAAWNRAYEALYPNVASLDDAERNLLWIIFTNPAVRELLADWATTSRHFVAEYRAQAGPLLGHPSHAGLIARLRSASPEFEDAWSEHRIEPFATRERHFRHPDVGELVFEHHRLAPSDVPETYVVIYLPADEATRQRMARLLGPAET